MNFNEALPVIFMAVMGLAMLAYVVLDGYDLGVGILLQSVKTDAEKDTMISSIGPFWDANETWLVLGVGILLTVFPFAHGIILGALYMPVAIMLLGLILRGVSFDFRVKARAAHKHWWDRAFFAGSLMAALSQGYMLGIYILGLNNTWTTMGFGVLIALCLAASYALLGASWLVMKAEGALQLKAVRWARSALWVTALGVAAVSIATPLASAGIFVKWFSLPYIFLLMPIPVATAVLFFVIERSLRRLPTRLAQGNEYGNWVPFMSTVGVFVLAFYGLAYSLFPFLVVDRITIWQAAVSPESMKLIFAGAVLVLPAIIGYTIFSYRVFRGKARELSYE
jgi:cytochrome bd ubiquinol oxidase subunit II